MSENRETKTPKSFVTRSGLPIQETYGPADLPPRFTEDPSGYLGEPGQYPFTRGVQKDMYRGRLWTMRQYAGFGSAEESNKRYHYLLSQGTMGLSVAFDLPTQLGYDPDHARSKGEVGKVGVSLSILDEMRTLFRGIDQSKVSTSMTINATASILLAFYVVVAEENGAKVADLRGTVQNDVLKEYVARGNYIYPPAGALRVTTDMFAWCARHAPKWNPISISGYHIREAGSTAVQELAFTFANAIAYVESAVASGLDVDAFAGQLSFFLNVHNDFLEEVAKFRAARRIWAKLMKERFGAKDPRSLLFRFHSQTAGSTLTAQQPYNNVVRVSLQALASVLGGTQSLHTNSLDEALSLPTETSAQIALRTQQVVAYESNVTQTVDPLAGSYFIENLTARIEAGAFEYLEEIEKRGGTIRCIEAGYIQTEISNAAYADQKKIESGSLKVVGVNCFKSEGDAPSKVEVMRIAPDLERGACERIAAYRQKRAAGPYAQAIQQLKDGAQSASDGINLQDRIIGAVRAGATLGEISHALKEVYGEHKDFVGF